MNLNRAYQWCCMGLAVLGILSYAVAAHQSAAGAPLLLVWALPALCTGWYLSATRSFVLPRAAVNALLAGALAYALLQAISAIDVNRIAELVIFLLIIKVGDRRAARDDRQIISLSVFLAIAAMLTGNSLLVGVLLGAFLPLLIATVMLFQLQAGWLAVNARAGGEATPPRWADVQVHGLGSMLRRVIGGSAAAILGIGLLVFVVLPRGVGENFLGAFGRVVQAGSITAFTDRVSLGDRGLISESPEVAFTMEIRDASGASLGGSDAVFYMRGAVLDEYDRGTWRPSHRADGDLVRRAQEDLQTGHHREPVPIGLPDGPLIYQTIRQSAAPGDRMTRLFTLWRPISIAVHRRGRLRINRATSVFDSAGEPGIFEYSVTSALADGLQSEPAERRGASFASPEIRALAAQVVRAAGIEPDPELRPVDEDTRAARAIQEHLRTGFGYTLVEQTVPSGTDPIEHFLFATRAGHCEYFASAMVAMCRSVGINARMVTGYVAAEYNEASGHYVVRQSNAHAWVETEAGPERWRRFDPTPPADLARLHRPVPGLMMRLRRVFDAAEYAWNQSVVGFDQKARERLLAPASSPGQAIASRLAGLGERIRLGGAQLVLVALARGLLVFCLVAAGGVFLLFITSRLRGWRSAPRSGLARREALRRHAQLRFYEQFLDALRRRGEPKPPWRPPLEHARALADPHAAGAAGTITRLYYRARFGGIPPSDAEIAAVRAELRRLARPAAPVR